MSAEDERRLDAEASLRSVHVREFVASPSNIEPFGESVLSWRISAPELQPPIRVALIGAGLNFAVARTGNRTVSPVMTSSYRLVASLPRASTVLATRTIDVDTSQCVTVPVTEAQARARISPRIDEIIAEHRELSRRRDDRVEIDYAGLSVSIRLKAVIDDLADPNIDVDVIAQFYAEGGRLRYRLVGYSLDVDFPGWADALMWAFWPAWLATAMAENNQDSIIRVQITSALDDFIAEQQALADDASMRILSVVARPDAFDVVLCPADATARRLPRQRARRSSEDPGLASSTE